jgi:hypothetical protein
MYELRTIVINGRNGNKQFVLTDQMSVQGTTEYCLYSLYRYIVYNLYAVVMENSICGGGIHNNNNNVIVPIKGPRRGRVTCKTNIDSMYI